MAKLATLRKAGLKSIVTIEKLCDSACHLCSMLAWKLFSQNEELSLRIIGNISGGGPGTACHRQWSTTSQPRCDQDYIHDILLRIAVFVVC